MNAIVRQEIKTLTSRDIARIKSDYRQGTGLTIRDIMRKYSLTFATSCYIVKSL